MDALQLIERLAQLRPDCEPAELLRIGLLLALRHPQLDALEDEAELQRQCDDIAIQLSATADQHSAVADELDGLAAESPCDFSPDHLWTLVRAIKVQSQILNLYLGSAEARR